jgi:hypothetical protein
VGPRRRALGQVTLVGVEHHSDHSQDELAQLSVEEALAVVPAALSAPEKVKTETARKKHRGPLPKIEIFYFAACPNYEDALSILREELAAQGITTPVGLVAVETQEEAERQQFYGSPTIRIDDRDIVPPAPNSRPALACRVYRRKDGAMTPIPPVRPCAPPILPASMPASCVALSSHACW